MAVNGTAMICIDRATIENGRLQIAAGHNKSGIFREWEPPTEEDMTGMILISRPTDPGDVIIYDSHTPHVSEAELWVDSRGIGGSYFLY